MSLAPPAPSQYGFPPPPRVRPSRGWYFVPLLLLVLVVVPSVWALISGIGGLTEGLIRVEAPGEQTVHLGKGTWTVFYEYQSQIDGQLVYSSFDYPGAQITVTTGGGSSIPVSSTGRNLDYSVPNHIGYSIAEFTITTAGDYEFAVEDPAVETEPFVLALGRDKVKSTLKTVFGAIGIFGGGFVVLCVWAIIFFVRMARRRRLERTGFA